MTMSKKIVLVLLLIGISTAAAGCSRLHFSWLTGSSTAAPTVPDPTVPPSTAATTVAPSTAAPTVPAPTMPPSTAAPTVPAPTVAPSTAAPTVPPSTAAPTVPAPPPSSAPAPTQPEGPHPYEKTEMLPDGGRLVTTFDELDRPVLTRRYGADGFLEKEERLSYHGETFALARLTSECFRLSASTDQESYSDRSYTPEGRCTRVRIRYFDGRTYDADFSETTGEMTYVLATTAEGKTEYKAFYSFNDSGTLTHFYTESLSGRIEEVYYYDDGSERQKFLREDGVDINMTWNEAGKLTYYYRVANDVVTDNERYTYDGSGTILTEASMEYRDSSGQLLSSLKETYYPDGARRTIRRTESDGTVFYAEFENDGSMSYARTVYPDGTSEEAYYYPGMVRSIAYYANGFRSEYSESSDDGTLRQTLYRENGSRILQNLDRPDGTFDHRTYDENNQMVSWNTRSLTNFVRRDYTNGRLTLQREFMADDTLLTTTRWTYSVRDGERVVMEVVYDPEGREIFHAWYEDDGKIGYPPED